MTHNNSKHPTLQLPASCDGAIHTAAADAQSATLAADGAKDFCLLVFQLSLNGDRAAAQGGVRQLLPVFR